MNEQVESRITHNPLQCGVKPCIRGMRIWVSDILQMLAEGVTTEIILLDNPDLDSLTSKPACSTQPDEPTLNDWSHDFLV